MKLVQVERGKLPRSQHACGLYTLSFYASYAGMYGVNETASLPPIAVMNIQHDLYDDLVDTDVYCFINHEKYINLLCMLALTASLWLTVCPSHASQMSNVDVQRQADITRACKRSCLITR